MRYSESYKITHDIDWFFQNRGRFFHVASNGGDIPNVIDARSNRQLQRITEELETLYKINRIDNNPNDYDYSSFYQYAAKGFISIDRKSESYERQDYYVVAQPKNGETPPPHISDRIPELDIEAYNINIDGLQ